MARPFACRNPCWNPSSTDKDELAGAAATEGSGTSTNTSVMSHAPIPASATAPAVAPSLDNKLFK